MSPSVFITGATGLVGSALVKELQQHNYKITALARSDASAAKLQSQGISVVRGSLTDVGVLQEAASRPDIDGVIHLAFIHKFDEYAKSAEIDAAAIAAFGEALKGSNKALVVSSAVALDAAASDGVARETDRPLDGFPRRSESIALELRTHGITPAVIRLSPTVHSGDEDKAFIRILINSALTHKKAVYIEPSTWSAVHVKDAASLYRLAFEAAVKGKSGVYHGVAEGNVPFKTIAQTIAKKTGTIFEAASPEDAAPYISFLAHFAPIFKPTSSEQTKAELGWKPTHIDLLSDIKQNYAA